MTKEKQWDGDAFRRGMTRQAESANRYADEHADRLRRNQSNGSASTRDEYRGETELYDYLSTSVVTESASALSRELDRLETVDTEKHFSGDPASFRKGYDRAIAQIRKRLKDGM